MWLSGDSPRRLARAGAHIKIRCGGFSTRHSTRQVTAVRNRVKPFGQDGSEQPLGRIVRRWQANGFYPKKHAVIVRPAEEQQLPPACGRIAQNNGSRVAHPVSSTRGEHTGGALEAPAGRHLAPYGISIVTGQDAAQPQSLGPVSYTHLTLPTTF